MATRDVEAGETGKRTAVNLAEVRDSRHMSQAELAGRMIEIGRPMSASVVSKTEKQDRRIDVDDLVAFAVALDTTPNRLLLTGGVDERRDVELTSEVRLSEMAAWRWANGEEPLPSAGDDSPARRLRYYEEGMPQHSVGSGASNRRAQSMLATDPEMTRMASVIVNATRRRGLDLSDLLDIIGYVHVQEKFGLPYGSRGGE